MLTDARPSALPARPAHNPGRDEDADREGRRRRRVRAAPPGVRGLGAGGGGRGPGVRLRGGVQPGDQHHRGRDHVDPGDAEGAGGGARDGAHRGGGASLRHLRGVPPPVHQLRGIHLIRRHHGRILRQGRRRAAPDLRCPHQPRRPRHVPYHHRGCGVGERIGGGGAPGRAAGVVRGAVVERPGGGAAADPDLRAAAAAPAPASRLSEVHIGGVRPARRGFRRHQLRLGYLCHHHRCHQDPQAPPRPPPQHLRLRALHRRPRHRPRLHLPLQRPPDPRRDAEVVGHDPGRAGLPGAVLRHLRRRGARRIPPLRGRHHVGHPFQLRQELRRQHRPAGERRRPAELRPPPRPRLPAHQLLPPDQRRRAPLPQKAVAALRRAPLRLPDAGFDVLRLPRRHRHPQHLDAVPVLWVDHRRLPLLNIPGFHCSQGCAWDRRPERQGDRRGYDCSGGGDEHRRHILQHRQLFGEDGVRVALF